MTDAETVIFAAIDAGSQPLTDIVDQLSNTLRPAKPEEVSLPPT